MTQRRTRPARVGSIVSATIAAVAVLSLSGILVGVTTGTASAIDQSKGTPGFCPTAQGVTVVVDFQQLGGETIVRCFPTSSAGTGLDALVGAGFQIEGVQRWGDAFICRIENRPSAVESIPIQGNSGYHERCIDTPPASAYWSYWWAGNNCAWQYSPWGVKNRSFVMGGFEGWSFSLNATANDRPKPRIAPVRPGTAGGACSTPDEAPPGGNDPGEHQPSPTTAPHAPSGVGPLGTSSTTVATQSPSTTRPERPSTAGHANGSGPGTTTASAPPTLAAADPSAHEHFTGGERAADVRKVLQSQSKASPAARVAAIAAIVALIAGATYTARRRRHAREA